MMTPAEIEKWLHPDGQSLIKDSTADPKDLEKIFKVFQIGPDHWAGRELQDIPAKEEE